MSDANTTSETGVIAWFASNPVAANLLMVIIIVFGIVSTFTIRKQTFPDFDPSSVTVTVPYLGAAPQEVEEGVIIKVEEAIQDVDGIEKIESRAVEGMGTVTAEVAAGEDIDLVLSEIKNRVDSIATFPGLTEKPVIAKREFTQPVILVAIHGDLDEFARKSLAQQLRDDLVTMPEVNQVEILGDRDYEISIEVSEQTLRRYGLTMTEVARAVQQSSVDLPGGTIKTAGGDILLRTEGQVYSGFDYADIVLRTRADGTRLLLSDIAEINDGFVEDDGFGRFDGNPSATLQVVAGAQQNELATAAAVRDYIEDRAADMPDGVYLDTWVDRSFYLKDRLEMMVKNMGQGALLVIIVLALFLRLKIALWVLVGIPIAFFGSLWLMPHAPWPVTINMISLFGFILVLGIVVDDAIVIGESIYTQTRADGHDLNSVVRGAKKVALPATFGVLTTIAAFAPMLFVGGQAGPFFEAMSVVVILCLLFSLVESKLILPAHLAHATIKDVDEDAIFRPYRETPWWKRPGQFFQRLNRYIQHGLHNVIDNYYQPLLERAVDARGVTVALFASILILTFGLFGSGYVRFVLFPDTPSDYVQVTVEMEDGTAPIVRNETMRIVEQAAFDMTRDWMAENPGFENPIRHIGVFSEGNTTGQVYAEMPLDPDRPLNGDDLTAMWREQIGDLPGVRQITFSDARGLGGGAQLSYNLIGNDIDRLQAVAAEVQAQLATYEGVFDIRSSLSTGGEEIRLRIKPEAEALGLTMSSLGQQVRQAFYGEEAQRIQRGKDELKVMVRYPIEERRSVADLQKMRIRTPAGDEVPFLDVAEVEYGKAFSAIRREDRQRVVTVSADIDAQVVEPGPINRQMSEEFLPSILPGYPGVEFALEGASAETRDFILRASLAGVAALFLIYALIAIPLKSYSQPLVIMSVIPFGLIGAVVGHLMLGIAFSMFSVFGLIALAGVVVNDSLILLDFVNSARAKGVPLRTAVIQSGVQRFRAIILTSLTTAAGLMPIMLEKSVQAQFVIPMAVSLSFGILFATVITLFLIPSLYMLREDGMRYFGRTWNLALGRQPTKPAITA